MRARRVSFSPGHKPGPWTAFEPSAARRPPWPTWSAARAWDATACGVHEFSIREIEVWAATDVDGIALEDDWGSQSDLTLPAGLWRGGQAAHRRYCEIIHAHDKFVFFKSAGWVEDTLEDLLEIGIDAVHMPLGSVDFRRLADQYRNRITFWGGLQGELLARGTPEAVRQAVHRCRTALDFGRGGLIAQCQWGPDTCFENIVALFRILACPRAGERRRPVGYGSWRHQSGGKPPHSKTRCRLTRIVPSRCNMAQHRHVIESLPRRRMPRPPRRRPACRFQKGRFARAAVQTAAEQTRKGLPLQRDGGLLGNLCEHLPREQVDPGVDPAGAVVPPLFFESPEPAVVLDLHASVAAGVGQAGQKQRGGGFSRPCQRQKDGRSGRQKESPFITSTGSDFSIGSASLTAPAVPKGACSHE